MRPWIALALIACQRNEPAPAPEPPPQALNVALVGCAPAGERPAVARADGDGDALPIMPSGWFPYATGGGADDAIATPVAKAAALALSDRLAELDLCLTGKTGSVSLMLEVAKDGIVEPRVGGIGHRPTEQCIADVAKQIKLAPSAQLIELECGLSAGAAGPFRVSVDGGYRVIAVTRDGITLEGKQHAFGEGAMASRAPHLLDTFLVVADPDVPASSLARVLAWIAEAPAVLVAVKADGGPPVFVAMAPDRRRTTVDKSRVGVQLVGEQLQACAGTQRGAVSLLEPKRVDAMMGGALSACGDRCDDVVEVALGTDHAAKQLVGATSAVRRAGRDPVLAFTSRCAP